MSLWPVRQIMSCSSNNFRMILDIFRMGAIGQLTSYVILVYEIMTDFSTTRETRRIWQSGRIEIWSHLEWR